VKRSLSLAVAVCIATVGAGCGGSKTVTEVQTVSGPGAGQTTATVPSIGDAPAQGTAPSQQQPPPPSSAGTLSQAEGKVRAEGYTPDDPGDYRSAQTLRVLVGTRAGSGDGYAKRAFFFVGGRYLGTDTSDDSANVRVDGQSDSTVTLSYALYGRNDALCCPAGEARVRYQWNGSRLVPLDPIPSHARRG
jgi:hypothetical protein